MLLHQDSVRWRQQERQYTGRRWTDARDYDMVVNTSALGFEECADIIVDCIDKRVSHNK